MSGNPWILHVKEYAKANNISYGCAISEAKHTYVKKPSRSENKKTSRNEIKELEEKLEDERFMYEELTISVSGKFPPNKRKSANASLSRYNKLKDTLEKMTGKKYKELKSFSDQQKEIKALMKKEEAEDRKMFKHIDYSDENRFGNKNTGIVLKKGRSKVLF